LNQNSEVVSMKAAGISAHQIIAPLIVASFAVAAVSFVFNERVVTRATETLAAWEKVDYGPVPKDSGIMPNVWVRFGDDLVLAREVKGSGAKTELSNITIYDRTWETLQAIVNAERALFTGGEWLLEDVDAFDIASGRVAKSATRAYGKGLDPTQFTLAKVDPEEETVASLRAAITQLKLSGRDTAELETGLWHKFSGPLSAVLMPLLAAVAAFGLARSGQLFLRAVGGMALGFAYFVADNFAVAMGNLGAYPPLLAAWAPFALFLLIGETVLVRTEE
jgi:lipopolysaccharide export system permease protein